ncbi:MAG: archaetidylserine decarboxylase [Gammaproteobacteria bacterium]|nr:archaetidylserine decarboxylase [Gammaproteobacteria bacterium]
MSAGNTVRPPITSIQRLHIALLYCLPHHLISRCLYYLTRRRLPGVTGIIRWFVRSYAVDLHEAEAPQAAAYATFNDFFTRALASDARTIVDLPHGLVSPVDGTVSEIGRIESGRLLQAKGFDYGLAALLGGGIDPEPFRDGAFATLYLSPRDYHRVHMPCSGTLAAMSYVPGRLFSVAPHTVATVEQLFTRNERVACLFAAPLGPVALVLVGAINVAAIETVWSGLVTPPHRRQPSHWRYTDTPVELAAGEEMGRFNMGSTVILVAPSSLQWLPHLAHGTAVRLGEALGSVATPAVAT